MNKSIYLHPDDGDLIAQILQVFIAEWNIENIVVIFPAEFQVLADTWKNFRPKVIFRKGIDYVGIQVFYERHVRVERRVPINMAVLVVK